MTLDYSKEGYCQITIFENLKAILETFEKLIQKQKVQRRAQRRRIYSQYKKTARILTGKVVSSSTSLCHKCCSLINAIGLTQEQKSHF